MIEYLLSLEWKAFKRSASFGKSLGLKIFLIFLGLYFALVSLSLGFGLYPILQEFFPGEDPLQLVNRFLLAWFLLELTFRFLLQTLPVIDIKPLLTLPIKKRKVVNFVLNKSLFSFYNLLPLLIIIPFGAYVIYKGDYGPLNILSWMLSVFALSLCVNFLNFIIKKRFTENLKALVPLVILVAAFGLLEYLKVFEISYYFGATLDYLVSHPYLAGVPLVFVAILYKWNQLNLEQNFYLDSGLKQKKKDIDTRDFMWTRRFGSIAPFLQQDLKLIWRNKRPKTTIYLSLVLLGYGLLFYPNDSLVEMPAFYIFVGVFMTGIFMINFGQFIPSWDASYYPLIMSQNIPMKQYLASKAGLISFSVVILAILTTPYVYYGWNILLLNLVCALYNIGVNVPVLLFAGSFNRKKIDLDKSPFMNYQGTGAAQWLVAIPLMVIPVLIFWGMYKFTGYQGGMLLLAGLGLKGLLLRGNILNFLAGRYKKNKYAMLQGFSQSGE
ncbi:DUF5687 family protein [Salegentibacter chungangensis]|uniref:DUF5687 family protein n=1 Tax=Salegentibacter chungangensis TaxID=1335724 RepID=A0ABW3NQ74_9FLAO